jgi:hypothetical protein
MTPTSTIPNAPAKAPTSAAPSKEELRTVVRCSGCGEYLIGTPMLQCSHGHILPIRCFWYRKGGKAYAECLDLDLITRGDTPEEAIGRLQEDMYWYINTVLSEGSKDSEGLIPRRAPWSSWVRYYFHTLLCRLRWMFSKHDGLSDHKIRNLGATKLSRC